LFAFHDMDVLGHYIDKVTLKELRKSFSEAAGSRVGFLDNDGEELVPGEVTCDGAELVKFPIKTGGRTVGSLYIEVSKKGGDEQVKRTGKMMADVLSRIARESGELQSRVEQLLAIHRVTAEIFQGVELQKILEMVTKTVVETMKQKSASIRRLSPDGKELTVHSTHTSSPQYMDLRPIPLEKSALDREVLNSDRPVYVEDMTTDPRVLDRESAKKEGVVSALCTPMLFDGKAEGVLRVFSGKKHVFDWFEIQLAQTLANAVAAAVAHNRSLKEANDAMEMKRQLNLASEVQRRMIPASPPELEGLEIADCYIPSQQLSGDFYDYYCSREKKTGFVICDVVGKGMRASLLMASIRASLQAHVLREASVLDTVRMVNHDLVRSTISSDFATMFYCELDLETMELDYCCAGHLPPFLVRDGKLSNLKVTGGMIGVSDSMTFSVSRQVLRPGDHVVMYTDGLVEAMNFDGEEYGRKRAGAALEYAVGNSYSVDSVLKHCVWDMHKFSGLKVQSDDLTMIGFKIK